MAYPMKHMINHLFSSINAAISINMETAKQQLGTEVIERLEIVFYSYDNDVLHDSYDLFADLINLFKN